MKHKLFVFDWNGTILADTRPSWRAGNECLKFYGAPPISLQRHRETFTFPIIPFYECNGVSAETVLARRDEGNEIFQKFYGCYAANARTRTNARDLLKHLNAKGVECIILSNYLTDKIHEHLERLKIDHYFSHVSAHDCGGLTILENTTKVQRLKHYMAEHGHTPEDTVIIGDTMEEPEIGRELGMTSIGITDGYITRKRLFDARPDYIVHRLGEIKTLGLLKS